MVPAASTIIKTPENAGNAVRISIIGRQEPNPEQVGATNSQAF